MIEEIIRVTPFQCWNRLIGEEKKTYSLLQMWDYSATTVYASLL
jgi:hypothetical protein